MATYIETGNIKMWIHVAYETKLLTYEYRIDKDILIEIRSDDNPSDREWRPIYYLPEGTSFLSCFSGSCADEGKKEVHKKIINLIQSKGKYIHVKRKKGWLYFGLPNTKFIEVKLPERIIKLKEGKAEYNQELGFDGNVIQEVGEDNKIFKSNLSILECMLVKQMINKSLANDVHGL